MPETKTLSDLRAVLFDTLEQLRDKDKPMEIERARAISDISGRLIETAKVECEYIDLVGAQGASGFIENTSDHLQAQNRLQAAGAGEVPYKPPMKAVR